VLSEAGHALLPYAETALAALRDAEAAVAGLRSAVGPLAVALVGTLASSRLTAVLRRFTQQHPKIDVRLRTATSDEVSELVRRAEVTMGLRYGPDLAPELHCEEIFAERQVIVAAADHELARTRKIVMDKLKGERWIAFPHNPARPEAANRNVHRVFDAVGVTDAQILRIDSLTAQKRLVEAGFGIALVPDSSVQEELAVGSLVVLDIADLDIAAPVTVVTRANGYLSAAARTLLEELR
jgi:DNA-binding transcriptional LysR family regulator